MGWLSVLQILWPIAVTLTPIVIGAGFLWLKTQFPTKAELTAVEKEIENRLNDHAGRFERGSTKFATHDRRLALVEEECKSAPSRQNLQVELSNLAQRMRGVEVSCDAVNGQLRTTNDYLHTLVERGLTK